MKNIKQKAFTLVELLVVITILAILSVVAYQSFGGATDKANNVTKKANITTLGNTLENFNISEHYYPMPQAYSGTTNLWGYNSGVPAQISNTIKVVYNDQEVKNIVIPDTKGGGKIMNSESTPKQIGAKGVIGTIGSFNKKFLKKDIYDTQIGDIKLTGEIDKKMIDYGVGKYTYAVYARASDTWNIGGKKGTYYELAATLKDADGEGYITYLEGNYSQDNFNNPDNYPESLIKLKNGKKDLNVTTTDPNQGIPYPIDGFAK